MRVATRKWIGFLILFAWLIAAAPRVSANPENVDLTPRLQEIYELRARWLLTGESPAPLEGDYLPDYNPAKWAIQHEQGKIRYVKQWAENRNVRFVHARPTVRVTLLRSSPDRARFYVTQSLSLGYSYPGEERVNKLGVGTRHIIELRRREDRWLIATEWYTDPLGDDTEVPDVTPALIPNPLLPATAALQTASGDIAAKGYDREGAVRYADEYCGVAWGCGNANRYNPRYRDFNGVGGDCTNYASQVLREGGGLSVPIITRVESLAAHLQHSGRATLVARGPFNKLWKKASSRPEGFAPWLKKGDLIAYQEKGKLEHFAVVTGFDTRGYPLINSHSVDRYHVPFDLGWDRKTVYWLLRMRD